MRRANLSSRRIETSLLFLLTCKFCPVHSVHRNNRHAVFEFDAHNYIRLHRPYLALRGGGKLQRHLSHHDIKPVLHGTPDTCDARVYAKNIHGGDYFSLWHDLPLFEVSPTDGKPTGALNFVCEITKGTRKKFEIATSEPLNPIKQEEDEIEGRLRSFKKGDIYFNWGCFPRTWEDPDLIQPEVDVGGNNDPVDVCEIGLRRMKIGEVRPVKVLGVLCVLDQGRTGWKIVAIDREDKWAPFLNDIDDVYQLLPGTLDIIRDWFRMYTIAEGKPPNALGFGGTFLPRAYALTVIYRTHTSWARLVCGTVDEALGAAQTETSGDPAAVAPVAAEADGDGEGLAGAADGLAGIEAGLVTPRRAVSAEGGGGGGVGATRSGGGSRSQSPGSGLSAGGPAGSTRKYTMKRNLSLPALDRVEMVQESLKQDRSAMHYALSNPRVE